MKVCKLCNVEFPSNVTIDGKRICLASRQYCLSCSPYKVYNRATLKTKYEPGTCVTCGNQFKGKYCMACKSKYMVRRWKNLKKWCIEYLGGKCHFCNGVFHSSIYQFHHIDSSTKLGSWNDFRKWSKSDIISELDKCVLTCANCHIYEHSDKD